MAASQGRRNRYTTAYVNESTVRKLEALPVEREYPRKKGPSKAVRRNRERALYMNIGYVMFLAMALVMVGFVLTSYLTLKADITGSVKSIARMESELNSLKLDNDERISRISSDTNLEEIKQKAIQELGMQYAKEGQIIAFSSEANDYVIQKGEIPD